MTLFKRLATFFTASCMSFSVKKNDADYITYQTRESPFRSPVPKRKSIDHHQKEHLNSDDQNVELCPICKDNLSSKECYVFTRCAHLIHIACYYRWPKGERVFCPCCIRQISEEDGSVCVPPHLERFIQMPITDRKRLIRGWFSTKRQ